MMKRSAILMRTAIFAAFMVCAIFIRAEAVNIPLEAESISPGSVTGSVKNSSGGIAYVDIEMIFNEHPMTQRLKGEFEAEVTKRKKELSDIEGSMKNIQNIIVSTTTEISNLNKEIEQVKKAIEDSKKPPQQVLLPGTTNPVFVTPVMSTSTVKADPAIIDNDQKIIVDKSAGIAQLKEEYSKKQKELETKNKSNKEDLIKLEDTNTKAVLNDIYKLLQKLAIEYNLTIVIDKNNVLYGQSSQDLTDKVRDMMRGR